MKIKKAIFPVAGLGSRFLPVTKASPKEMLPIVDKPLIQYAVEEAIRAGITHMIFVTSSSKRAIEDHFDYNYELEAHLQQQGKDELRKLVKSVTPPGITFTYVRQNGPLGLGHAILTAEHIIENEPFAVLLADDLIDEEKYSCVSEMVLGFAKQQSSLLAIQPVSWDNVNKYGIVCPNNQESDYSDIIDIVEKPAREQARSNLAIVGRYIFTPKIFSCLKQVSLDHRGEIQLTDGIQRLLKQENVQSYLFRGKRYDCGSKIGYLQASIRLGLRHPEIADELSAYLREINLEVHLQ